MGQWAGVMKVWEWVLDGLSFVLGEKRAKTARELFPDAPDIKAPLLFFISGGSH